MRIFLPLILLEVFINIIFEGQMDREIFALIYILINSLAIMIITIQDGMAPFSMRQIIAEQTSNLSANGSINLPKLVTRLYFLAILPSSMSVSDAAMNKTAPQSVNIVSVVDEKFVKTGSSITTMKIGTIISLITVSLFGRFIFIVLVAFLLLLGS